MTYEERLVKMRKQDNSYILTILQEAIQWNLMLDELVVLADVLRIMDKHNLGVSRNEVKKAVNRYYKKEYHGEKRSCLSWLYREFGIKKNVRIFTSQIRNKIPMLQLNSEGLEDSSNSGEEMVSDTTKQKNVAQEALNG